MFAKRLVLGAGPCLLLLVGCDDGSVVSNSGTAPGDDATSSAVEDASVGSSSEGKDSGESTDNGAANTAEVDVSSPGIHLFDPTRVAELAIEVTQSDLEVLREDADQPMGFEDFTYVPARITYDGTVLERVGIRVKGNSSRASAVGDAVPFKIDANRYVQGQRLDGETKVNLHNGANQPTLMNEYLSYGALRDFGVAASRTGWVDVTLNGESLGTYVTVEQVGDKLLSRYYADGDADLYKPEPPSGYLSYSGDDFSSYATANYEANNETDHATFLKLVKALDQNDVGEWEEVIDVQSVLDYFASNVALGNWDTYVAMGHNYYLFEATPGRMVMLPWDMNLSQAATSGVCPADVQSQGALPGGGGMGMLPDGVPSGGVPGGGGFPGGEPPQLADGGTFIPPDGVIIGGLDGGVVFGGGQGDAPLHDKLLGDPTYLARYLVRLKAFLDGPGSVAALETRLEAGRAALGDRVTDEAIETLRSAISDRVASISAAIPMTTSCGTGSGGVGAPLQ